MTNPILIKRSAVAAKAPATTDLSLGELAINTVDGKLYLKKNVTGTETIVEVGYAVSTAQSAADTAIGTAAAADVTAKVLVETNARVAADTAAIATAATAADAKVLVETNARVANDATTLASAKTYADGLITTITGGAGAAFDTLVEIQNAMATDAELTAAIAAITNVATATKLQTARTIQGVSFDGSAAITVATAGTGITVTGTTIATTITQYTDTGARAALSATAPVAYNSTTGVISIPAATTSVAGHLTAADWNTFNGKQAALGFTPYNATNPSGYITSAGTATNISGTYAGSITSAQVTTGLGFTPYNATNPSAYVTAAVTLTTAAQAAITSVGSLTALTVIGQLNAGNAAVGGTLTVTGTSSASTIYGTNYVVAGVSTGLTAAGTTQATALLLAKEINVVATVAAGSGVVFPLPVAGTRIVVINTSATSLNVYPSPTGSGIINSLAANAAFVVPAGGKLEFVSVSATQWYTLNATFA